MLMLITYIRKVSFTLCLNDNYEGGLFDLSIPNPKKDDITHTIDLKNFQFKHY